MSLEVVWAKNGNKAQNQEVVILLKVDPENEGINEEGKHFKDIKHYKDIIGEEVKIVFYFPNHGSFLDPVNKKTKSIREE